MKADSNIIVVNAIRQSDSILAKNNLLQTAHPNIMANDSMPVEIFVPLAFFITITTICVLGIYFSYRKRAVFADKGYTADDIIKIFGAKRKSFFTLKRFGIILIGIALGFFVGSFLQETTGQYYWFTPFQLLGIGLGLYYASKIENKNEV